ncbi:MAG: fumarate hydratase, partial [Methanobrevibacter sp.]|nr:fumarate hydratase [Methanobrevibacter sp.]
MIAKDVIKDTVYELYRQAVIVLGEDVKKSLEDALKIEEHDLAKLNIEAILKNIELAEEKQIPMC